MPAQTVFNSLCLHAHPFFKCVFTNHAVFKGKILMPVHIELKDKLHKEWFISFTWTSQLLLLNFHQQNNRLFS